MSSPPHWRGEGASYSGCVQTGAGVPEGPVAGLGLTPALYTRWVGYSTLTNIPLSKSPVGEAGAS